VTLSVVLLHSTLQLYAAILVKVLLINLHLLIIDVLRHFLTLRSTVVSLIFLCKLVCLALNSLS
jgi:hypothetical protein